MAALNEKTNGAGVEPSAASPRTPTPSTDAPEAPMPDAPAVPVAPKIEVIIAPDAMSAAILITPENELSAEISIADLSQALAQAGVTHGIVRPVLIEAVAAWGREKQRIECHAAWGLAPRHGRDGTIDFLFETRTSLAPKENEDGTVDYREVNIFIPVGSGRELARLRPPTKGMPGKTVTGRELPCREGKPARLPEGANTGPAPNDQSTLVATKDGVVRYSGSVVEVHEGFMVEGDVDFSTGNISYDKSVLVTGDIKPGFKVECGGDLQVNGLIEDCTLKAGGNVLCKHGFIGQGKGELDAGGDVNLGFIQNQTVRSRKNINIAREAINSRLFAQGRITVHGKPLGAVGGMLLAREAIELSTAGNRIGAATHLEVGSDFSLMEELNRTGDEEHALKEKHLEYSELVTKYRHFSLIRKHLTATEKLLVEKLTVALARIEEQLRALVKWREEIRSKLYEEGKASIRIEQTAYPGTAFKIGEQHYMVETELIGPKTVRLDKGSLVIG